MVIGILEQLAVVVHRLYERCRGILTGTLKIAVGGFHTVGLEQRFRGQPVQLVITVNELPAVIHCKTGNEPGLFGIIALVVVVINGLKLMTSYVFLDRVKAVEGVVGVAYVSAVAAVKTTTINRRNFDRVRCSFCLLIK